MKIDAILSKHGSDIKEASEWCESLYSENFEPYFQKSSEIYHRMQSTNKPISDSELEIILTDVPLDLLAVSEVLNNFKISVEVIKLNLKKTKFDILQNSQAKSQSARSFEADNAVVEDEFLIKLYSSIIDRVENQIAFSKELIMSAKKIWTSRKEAELISKSSENVELPDYDPQKVYVK